MDEAIRAHDHGVIKGVHKLFFYQEVSGLKILNGKLIATVSPRS